MDLISIYCQAIKTEFWIRAYESFQQNKTPFEVVYVGDVKPDFKLPSNLRHIYSPVKPAQCGQIGAMESQGNYIINVADDSTLSEGALDSLLAHLKGYDEKTIITPTFYEIIKKPKKQPQHAVFNKKDIVLPVGSMMSKRLFEQLNGYDRNFVGLYYDVDFALRVQQQGGQTVVEPNARVYEHIDSYRRLYKVNGKADRKLFYSLWRNKRSHEYVNRKKEFEPYNCSAKDFLTKSQGKCKPWK